LSYLRRKLFQTVTTFFFLNATIAKYKFLPFVYYNEYLEENPALLGGAGIIVEVDKNVCIAKKS